jgi:hypothetical protein
LVLAVNYEANQNDATVPNLQIFDLQGNRVYWNSGGTWAIWVSSALYFDGGDGKVYRWVLGGQPVEAIRNYWLEPAVSPDGLSFVFLSRPSPPNTASMTLNTMDRSSGVVRTLAASDLRIYPLFVSSTLIWVNELVTCDNCYGGNTMTGKVLAFDLATGSTRYVKLPEPLGLLAPASLSPGA